MQFACGSWLPGGRIGRNRGGVVRKCIRGEQLCMSFGKRKMMEPCTFFGFAQSSSAQHSSHLFRVEGNLTENLIFLKTYLQSCFFQLKKDLTDRRGTASARSQHSKRQFYA